ncbi:VOC family protein [Sphingobium sp. EM0848]|uniref:VOC family protein n=1 Tax=Sphingobium sp. EM0848 TaxID=2743473 RepID=UPI00159C802D|nr:VOC family protein [Sphingobium sp. EM0848]
MTGWTIGHIGICVTDLERSVRFWCEGLGFEMLREFAFKGDSWRRILEIDGSLDLQTRIIRRDHMTLELLHFISPGHEGPPERVPMNRLGFTHLAIWVKDIDAVAARVVEYGGAVVEDTRVLFDHPLLRGRWLICTDPDGLRLELVEYPDGEDVLER